MSARGVLRIIEGARLGFWCPGCKEMHVVTSGWSFDGNYDRPTFSPSVLVHGVQKITDDERARIMGGEKITPRPLVCHSFVRDGQIQFLGDCTHQFAGKTVSMEPF